jgi:hypothetical protein
VYAFALVCAAVVVGWIGLLMLVAAAVEYVASELEKRTGITLLVAARTS